MESVDPRKLIHQEKLAFWINIHNALVMHVSGFLCSFDLTSVFFALLYINLYFVFTIADISGKWDSTEQWEAVFTALQGNISALFLVCFKKKKNDTEILGICLTFSSQLTT